MSHRRRWRIELTTLGGTPAGARPRVAARRLGLMLLVSMTGCYTYRPVATPGPESGARISVEVSGEGAAALTPLLGPDVSEINGRVETAGPDTLRLSVLSVTNRRGIPVSWRGELIDVPRTNLGHIGQRHLATGGTFLLGAGITGGLYFLYHLLGGPAIINGSGGSSGGGGR